MTLTKEWLDLRDAVKRVCDEKLVMHRQSMLTDNPTVHAHDCPGCALREALNAVGVSTTVGAS